MACPDETVLFTCTVSGTFIRWDLTSGANLGFTTDSLSLYVLSTMNTSEQTIGPMFVFQDALTDLSGGMVTATLITVTEVSVLEGSMVECGGADSREGPLTISVAIEACICV